MTTLIVYGIGIVVGLFGMMIDRLGASPWQGPPAEPPPPPPAVEPMPVKGHPTEAAFLDALRSEPDDGATRLVYADWLEQQGQQAKALFVRGERPDPVTLRARSDLEWRAIACRGQSACCTYGWNALVPVEPRLRRCPTCTRLVRYSASDAEVRAATARGERAVLDLAE